MLIEVNSSGVMVIIGFLVTLTAMILVFQSLDKIADQGRQTGDYDSYTKVATAISNECKTAASDTDEQAFKGETVDINLKQHNIRIVTGSQPMVLFLETTSDNQEENRNVCGQDDVSLDLGEGSWINGDTIPTGPITVEIEPKDSGEVQINASVSN